MKLKTILLIVCLILVVCYIFYFNIYINEKPIEKNSISNDEVWYPESLEDCKKQKEILLDGIKQLEGNN